MEMLLTKKQQTGSEKLNKPELKIILLLFYKFSVLNFSV